MQSWFIGISVVLKENQHKLSKFQKGSSSGEHGFALEM